MSKTPDPDGKRVEVAARDLLTVLILLTSAGLIIAAVTLLTGFKWGLLTGGITGLAAAFLIDAASDSP